MADINKPAGITFMWMDGRALLSINDATISLNISDAGCLARDLGNGHKPACFGYPIPTDVEIGGHVIDSVTRVANDNTIVKIARVVDYEHNTALDLDEVYADAGSVSLTPADRDALVDLLKEGIAL